jgi:hypothetical protein
VLLYCHTTAKKASKMATVDKTENKTKVLVNVYEPLIAIMKHKFDAACLKRDAYLDKALRIEANVLREEIEVPNSDRARNFITENFKELKLKPLSLSLSIETAELINEVCKDKNVPRDSFINRFFLLMIASDTILKALFFFHRGKIEDIETAYEWAVEDVYDDFRDIHPVINEKQINGLDIIELYSNKSPLYIIRKAFNGINIIEYDWVDGRTVLKNVYGDNWGIYTNRKNVNGENFGLYTEYNSDKFYKKNSSTLYGDYPEWIEIDLSKAKKIKTYTYVFNKICFNILPEEYSFIKTNNMFGFNTYIPDDELPKEETSSPTTLAKNELDKLLAFTKSEKTRTVTKKDTNPTEGESQ